MSSLEENMEEMLNISAEPVSSEPIKPKPPEVDRDDREKDYQYTRGELYSLIDKGQEAVNGALEVAQESGHPRAYEVAGQLIGQVAGTVDKLQDLQKKLKDLKELPKTANANIKNALFVGSTAELQKMLNKKKKKT